MKRRGFLQTVAGTAFAFHDRAAPRPGEGIHAAQREAEHRGDRHRRPGRRRDPRHGDREHRRPLRRGLEQGGGHIQGLPEGRAVPRLSRAPRQAEGHRRGDDRHARPHARPDHDRGPPRREARLCREADGPLHRGGPGHGARRPRDGPGHADGEQRPRGRRAPTDARMAASRRDRAGARDPLLVRPAGQVVVAEPRPAHRDAAGPRLARLGPLDRRRADAAVLEACITPSRWRGWFDFGTGALGDMAIHNMDPAFYALDLGAPTAVEATTSELKPESYPLWTILRYEFAAKGDRPAVTLTWYDGGKLPPRPRDLPEGTSLSDNGIYFVGDKGTLVCGGWSGPPTLYPESPPQGIPSARADDPPLDRPPPGMDQGVQGSQARGRQGGLRLLGPFHRGAPGRQPGPAAPEADRMGRRRHEGDQRPRGR